MRWRWWQRRRRRRRRRRWWWWWCVCVCVCVGVCVGGVCGGARHLAAEEVEVGGDLVEEEHRLRLEQLAQDLDAAPLAVGARRQVPPLVDVEQRLEARDARRVDADRRRRHELRHLHRLVRHVVADEVDGVRPVAGEQRHLGRERRVVERRPPVDERRLLVDEVAPADDREQRRLARAVRAHQHAPRAARQLHRHRLELQLLHHLRPHVVLLARRVDAAAAVAQRLRVLRLVDLLRRRADVLGDLVREPEVLALDGGGGVVHRDVGGHCGLRF